METSALSELSDEKLVDLHYKIRSIIIERQDKCFSKLPTKLRDFEIEMMLTCVRFKFCERVFYMYYSSLDPSDERIDLELEKDGRRFSYDYCLNENLLQTRLLAYNIPNDAIEIVLMYAKAQKRFNFLSKAR